MSATYLVVVRRNGYKVIGPFASQSAEVAWVAAHGGGNPIWESNTMTAAAAANPQVLDPGDPAAITAFESVGNF